MHATEVSLPTLQLTSRRAFLGTDASALAFKAAERVDCRSTLVVCCVYPIFGTRGLFARRARLRLRFLQAFV